MASWISKIAMALQSNEGYANFFVADVRERTGREVSDQEILEAVRETKKHPLPWKEYHGRQVQWTTAKPAEAVVRYLKNPSGYYRDVQKRQQERLRDQEPLQNQKESRKKQREMLEQLERQADKLTQDQEWQEVAKVCRRWLEIAPDSAPPMYRLAHAYYNLGRLNEAEELCKSIRSRFRLHPNALHAVETLLQEISAREASTTEGVFSASLLPQWQQIHSQTVNQLLVPDANRGEAWITQQRLANIVQALTEGDRTFDISRLEQFSRECWVVITSQRRYQVPSQGRAEILASARLSDLVDLRMVRFIQEGAGAPEVFVRLEFGEPPAIGIVKVRRDGSTEGFHTSVESSSFKAIIEATALAYYRDLVVPGRVYSRAHSGTSQVEAPPSSAATETSHTQNAPVTQHQTHRLPRTQVVSPSSRQMYRLEEWYHAQERARHSVVGHTRWIGQDFRAVSLKRHQARKAGVELQAGYTWVVEHERGGRRGDELKLSDLDLAERTRFLPPEKASYELDRLLL